MGGAVTWLAAASVLAWTAPALGAAPAAEVRAPGDLERIDEALAGWIQAIDADRPYLLVDGSAGEVRLQHGVAVLRQCPVVAVAGSLARVGPSRRLSARLRRFRRTDPFLGVEPGPFDWEHQLVIEATKESALLFTGGLLLYAADAWEPVRPPSIRLRPADLRALYDAVADSVEIVVLPRGWEEGPDR